MFVIMLFYVCRYLYACDHAPVRLSIPICLSYYKDDILKLSKSQDDKKNFEIFPEI